MNSFRPRNPSVDGGLAALVFDVGFEDLQGGPSNRTQEEATRPEGTRMFAMIDRAKAIQDRRSALAFERPYKITEDNGWRIPEQHVDVIIFAIPLHNLAVVRERDLCHTGLNKVSLLRSECMPTELRTKDDVHGQVINTVACTVKVKIPDTLAHRLDTLLLAAVPCIARMLHDRSKSSSKYYPEIPCVISKSLITKYQRNTKCRSVSRPVLPVCGDKGKQIKLTETGVRIPAIFGKTEVPVVWPRLIAGHIRQIEFFRRDGAWYGSICFNTPAEPPIASTGVIGVDRNSVGNIAVFADPQTGTVRKLGICPARTKQVFRNRRRNLQIAGKFGALKKMRRKQSRRMTYENHRASKAVVDYAATHCRTVVMERLENVHSKGSKIRRYAETNQWAFAQLGSMIRYKCALRGIPLVEVDPAYTSQICSRCGSIHKPNGKRFKCLTCPHNDHRDANAAFNIAVRGADGSSGRLSVRPLGFIGDAQAGKERGECLR